MGRTVLTCGTTNSYGGFLVFGEIVATELNHLTNESMAVICFRFRDDYVFVTAPTKDIRSVDKGCHTCKKRLGKMLGYCDGEYHPIQKK